MTKYSSILQGVYSCIERVQIKIVRQLILPSKISATNAREVKVNPEFQNVTKSAGREEKYVR